MIDHNNYKKLLSLVNEQAEDEGLWFEPQYATEAILMRALRRLHAAIESDWELVKDLGDIENTKSPQSL